jgi:hypothetical protein
VVLALGGILLLAVLAGAGPWMLEHVAPAMDKGLGAVALVFGISLVLHLGLILPLWLINRLIGRATGMKIVRQGGK